MRRLVFVVLGVLALGITACGVPKSGKFSAIDQSRIPSVLIETTTTLPATTTTVAEAPTTTAADPPTTTTPNEEVTLFFVVGDQLQGNTNYLVPPVSSQQALQALKNGPSPEASAQGLRSAIPRDAGFLPTKSRGIVTVDINPTFFDSMPTQDQRLAVGQIVLTLTQLGGVGAVTFTSGGEPISVFLADGQPSGVGQPLYAEDYENLLVDAPPQTTTTTTTVHIDESPITAPPG